MPPFEDLLDFLDLQACDTENSVHDVVNKSPTTSNPGKRMTKSYKASVEDTCVACNKDYYPLYGCKSFIALLPDKRMELVRENRLCMNCLKSGHFTNQCPFSQKCKKCRRSHHPLLHKDWTEKPFRCGQSSQSSETREDPTVVMTHTTQSGRQQQVLLMTCQIIVVKSNGTSYKAKTLLDSGSSASFISERSSCTVSLPAL